MFTGRTAKVWPLPKIGHSLQIQIKWAPLHYRLPKDLCCRRKCCLSFVKYEVFFHTIFLVKIKNISLFIHVHPFIAENGSVILKPAIKTLPQNARAQHNDPLQVNKQLKVLLPKKGIELSQFTVYIYVFVE